MTHDMLPLGEAVLQRPLWVPGAGGPLGDAGEPSPHELAVNGAIPHGRIPPSQPKPEDNDMLKLSLYVPHRHLDFLLNLILTSLGLSQGSESLLSKEEQMWFFLHPTLKSHAPGGQHLPSH